MQEHQARAWQINFIFQTVGATLRYITELISPGVATAQYINMKMTETGFFGKQNYTTLFVIAKAKPEAIHVVFWIASGFVPRGRNDE